MPTRLFRSVASALIVLGATTLLSRSRPALAQAGPYQYYSVTPCRAYDTRAGSVLPLGPIAAAEVRTFTLKGLCLIPNDAKAVSLNLTVTEGTGWGDVRIAPTGVPFPNVSTLNYVYQETLANGAILPLNPNVAPPVPDIQVLGAMCCATPPLQYQLIIDVTGYFK